MTERFYKYGIHAEVNDSGELFLNATAATLGCSATQEFCSFLMVAEDLHAVRIPAVLDELSVLTQDQADANGLNDDDYRAGRATPLETNLEILAAQEPGLEQVSAEQFANEVEALNGLGEVLEVVPTEGFDDVAEAEKPTPPPAAGPGATQKAWAQFAAEATGRTDGWGKLNRKQIQAQLKTEGLLS